MRPARAIVTGVADAGRRLTGTPEWPVIVAVVLVVLAVIEASGSAMVTTPPVGFDPRVKPDFVNQTPNATLAVLLAMLGTAPIAFVRVATVSVATTISVVNYLALVGDPRFTFGAMVAQAATTYALARRGQRWVWGMLLVPAALYWVAPVGSQPPDHGQVSFLLLCSVAAGLTADAARSRAEARQRRVTEEVVADTLLDHAARGERARIARELHDVVAHHISMISIQAETARLTTPGMPAVGAQQLSDIGETAREALTEMRRLLGVLREDVEAPPARAPQPGVAQLVDLIDDARSAAGGASTRLLVHGAVRPLDPGIELTAYRIAQEALTNARRHAPGAAVDVELGFDGESLNLRIRDNGPGPSDPAVEGHGLLGMRERAGMVGGTLTAGPAPRAGFEVRATLPLTGVER